MYTNFEVKILSNESEVKDLLMNVSTDYQEDFLLDDIVFVTLDNSNLSKLKSIAPYIILNEETFAYQL